MTGTIVLTSMITNAAERDQSRHDFRLLFRFTVLPKNAVQWVN